MYLCLILSFDYVESFPSIHPSIHPINDPPTHSIICLSIYHACIHPPNQSLMEGPCLDVGQLSRQTPDACSSWSPKVCPTLFP